MISIKNKWAFITGGSRGIGKTLALFLADMGCNLVLQGRSMDNLSTTDLEVREKGVETRLIAAELSDMDAVESMLDEIDQLNLTIDYVFNNAGVQIGYRPDYYKTPDEDYILSFMINTLAPMKICYHFLPKMIENGFGRIVNTTSGIDKEPEQAGYSASKAALDKVTKDLGSKMTGNNVMISLFDPGWCRTDLGGNSAPNHVSTTIPGSALGAFVNDGVNGRIISAQDYSKMSLEEALKALQKK